MKKNLPRSLQKGRGWSWQPGTFFKAFGLAGAGIAGAYWYAKNIEPHWLQWKTIRLRLPGLDPAFHNYRLVQLSDLHMHNGGVIDPARLAGIVRRVNRWKPDVIALTGDFVTKIDETSQKGIQTLSGLRAKDGVYGIMGNHDYWTDAAQVTRLVEATGVRMLCNDNVILRRRNAQLGLAAVDNVWEGTPNLDHALYGIAPDTPTILLAHEPNYADVVHDPRVKLQLSGHSHGGQVRIPFLGPLALPDLSHRFVQGLFHIPREYGELLLYVNRGIGLAEVGLRMFCRPEVTLFILESNG